MTTIKTLKKIRSLYVHIPFCKHLCNYCDFYKHLKDSNAQVDDFYSLLDQSLSQLSKLNKKYNYSFDSLETLYFGGGTPSLLGYDGLKNILALINKFEIDLANNCELTLETNPGTVELETLEKFKELGVNRLSLGIQSLNNLYLKKLDRLHNAEKAIEILEFTSKVYQNFSVDFMLGLPQIENVPRDIISELDQILIYDPPHISLYILTVKNSYIHQKDLPKNSMLEQEYLKVSEYLQKFGYCHYEVSNFSKKGYESIHNLNYWNSKTVSALGPSATGYLSESAIRYKWKNKSANYTIEKLDDSQTKLERFYLKLRTNEWLNMNEFFDSTTKIDKSETELTLFINLCDSWVTRGVCQRKSNLMRLNYKGFIIIDSLIDEVFTRIRTF